MPTPRARLGTWGEERAGRFLQDRGYRILTTNYRCSHGEVDIVAQDGQELVFVEVRTRHSDSFVAPQESLSKAKIRRLIASCQYYLACEGRTNAAWRIDLVCVYVERSKERDYGSRLENGRWVHRTQESTLHGAKHRVQHLPYAVQL